MDIFERLSGPILPLPGRNITFWVLSNGGEKKVVLGKHKPLSRNDEVSTSE